MGEVVPLWISSRQYLDEFLEAGKKCSYLGWFKRPGGFEAYREKMPGAIIKGKFFPIIYFSKCRLLFDDHLMEFTPYTDPYAPYEYVNLSEMRMILPYNEIVSISLQQTKPGSFSYFNVTWVSMEFRREGQLLNMYISTGGHGLVTRQIGKKNRALFNFLKQKLQD